MLPAFLLGLNRYNGIYKDVMILDTIYAKVTVSSFPKNAVERLPTNWMTIFYSVLLPAFYISPKSLIDKTNYLRKAKV